MTKEYFKEKSDTIIKAITILKEEQAKLREDYITSNQLFSVGQKVKVTTPPYKNLWGSGMSEEKIEFGIVSGHTVDYSDNISVELFQTKKDGSPSQRRLYYNSTKSQLEIDNN